MTTLKERKQLWWRSNPEKRKKYRATQKSKQRPVVYVYMAPDGKADWVGRGSPQRAKDHKYLAKWWTPQHLLLTMTCDSEWQAMEYEGKWGAFYQPRHNREGYRYSGAS